MKARERAIIAMVLGFASLFAIVGCDDGAAGKLAGEAGYIGGYSACNVAGEKVYTNSNKDRVDAWIGNQNTSRSENDQVTPCE